MLGEACKKCKLHEQCITPFQLGVGSNKPIITFIGEAPGEREDEQGEFFVGPSGEILRNALEVLELEPGDYRFENIVRCRPPNNEIKQSHINYCSTYLQDQIEAHRPKVIVTLGNVPMKTLLGQTGITSWNGAVIEKGDISYVPVMHPAYILRNGGFGSGKVNDQLLEEWMEALQTAINVAYNRHKVNDVTAKYTQHYPKTVAEIKAMVDELLEWDEIVAYDIETDNLDSSDPDNYIISIAFANSQDAWSFPLDHPEAWWIDDEWEEVVEQIGRVLTGCKIITHTKFDCKITRAKLGIDFQQYGDTIHLSKLLNSEYKEHGLKRLAGLNLEMYDYDEELRSYITEHPDCDPRSGGTYANIPLKILLPYGNLDVIATFQLHEVMYSKLTEQQRVLYEQVQVPADRVLGIMEENGMAKDAYIIGRYSKIYSRLKDVLYRQLLADQAVQQFIDTKQADLDADWAERMARRKTSRELKRSYFEFNPNSSFQMAELLYEYKGYKIPAYTKTGKPSIKKDYLKELLFDLQHEGGQDTKLLDDYMYWKLLSSIMSKTFTPMADPDSAWNNKAGRTSSTYGLNDTTSGRIASSKPNTQNIPTVEKEPGTLLQFLPIKNAFTHTWSGGNLVMIDYSGMELRVMSSVAGIQGMLDVFNRGGDVHKYVSSLIYGKPEAEIDKFERYRGKWCNWSLLYLGNWWTLYRLYRINGLTESEAKRVTAVYFEAFPELTKYHKRTLAFLDQNGFVRSPFGRELKLPEIYSNIETIRNKAQRTAVNMPIQGTASDVLMIASIIIEKFMREREMRSLLVNTVHDSIVGDVYPGELEEFIELCVDVMENVIDYAKIYAPDVNFSWLKVPLKADVDIGSHYGSYGPALYGSEEYSWQAVSESSIMNANGVTERQPRLAITQPA